MWQESYKYIIVGGGQAGGSAVEGIRQHDQDGSILMIASEQWLPHERPPLSKKLWTGKQTINDVFFQDTEFYNRNGVDMGLGEKVVKIDPAGRTVTTEHGHQHHYEKLLLATGGTPRRLDIPGGDLSGIYYYRRLEDYIRLRRDTLENTTAVVIGGGFIGSEVAAALSLLKANVTMVFPEPYLVQRIFPEGYGRAMQEMFIRREIEVLTGDLPVAVERSRGKYVTTTKNGKRLESDILLVGVGILPGVSLAESAGIEVNNGIVVDEYCRSSNPDIYAAGDNANFPYLALGEHMRVEHWDHALNQGRYAGMNMAGANVKYDYMPYFWSDLFEFGYEAVGDISSKLDVIADWEIVNDTGALYYLRDGRVRGVMTCNIYDRMDDARDLIRSGAQFTPDELRGRIRSKQNQAA